MIAVYLPFAWSALIPIILIETLLGVRTLGVPWKHALRASTIANSLSTLIGLPLTWFTLAVVEALFFGTARGLNTLGGRVYAVTIQAPWLIPYESDLWWMIPVAACVLAIPFFAVSVGSEYLVVQPVLSQVPRHRIWAWVLKANCYSYLFLLVLIGVSLAWSPLQRLGQVLFPVVEWLAEGGFRVAR